MLTFDVQPGGAKLTPVRFYPRMRALVRVLLCYGALEIVSVIVIIIIIFGTEKHNDAQRCVFMTFTKYGPAIGMLY